MRRMVPVNKNAQTLLFCALLVFSQWVIAGHSVELDADHTHGIDCAVCVLEKVGQAVSTIEPVQLQVVPRVSFVSLPAEIVGTSVERQSIRAPPC